MILFSVECFYFEGAYFVQLINYFVGRKEEKVILGRRVKSMKNNRVLNLLVVILYGICLVLWVMNALFHFYYHSPEWILYLNVICAVIWTIAFFIQLIRYKLTKKKEREDFDDEE